jgi:hypothetical protein
MKTKLTLFAFILIGLTHANAQNTLMDQYLGRDTLKIRNWYSMTASEIIFSYGEVKSFTGPATTETYKLNNIVRFTCFFHIQEQFHYNFNNHFGLYTGIGIRNVGLINDIYISDSLSSVTVKQRSYSLGIPLALKIGNMKQGAFLALGAEAELMFAYKEKILYNDQKTKFYDWFSDNVNLINPSLFADIRFSGGSYVRFKYYMMDFLKDKDMSFQVPTTKTDVYYRPESSTMMYIAIGSSFRNRPHHKHHTSSKTDV